MTHHIYTIDCHPGEHDLMYSWLTSLPLSKSVRWGNRYHATLSEDEVLILKLRFSATAVLLYRTITREKNL